MSSSCGSVVHQGDNLTGASDGESDEEEVNVDLAAIPSEINKVSIAVSIHDAVANHQNFGQVSNAYIRIVNQANNEEITRYDLTEDYSIETAMIFGELYRHNAEWKFRAVGQGYEGGLEKIMGQFGVDVS
jgi:tellurium resistance protein TerD